MKYYAVTDDPNELLHYGVKGMKWGQHLFGDDLRPKSAGYKRALGKLRNSAKKAKTATVKTVKNARASLQKSATQRAINKQQKQEDKYNKAVAKAQQRINIVSNLSNVDKMRTYEKHLESDYKAQRNADKAAVKREHKYAKNERKMDKYTQLAREGRLKYGKLSEEQVGRITDRLSLERQARVLGNTEKPKFRVRAKEALQEGMLQGIVQGTAAGMKEVAVAKVQNRLANKHVLDKNSAQEAKRQKEASRIKNKKSTREIKQDFKQEAREEEIREGVGWLDRHNTFKGASKSLQQIQQKRLEDDRVRKLQSRIQDEMDLENNTAYQRMLANREERNFLTEERHNTARAIRQNLENEDRDMRKLIFEGKLAYEHGLGPGGSSSGGGQKNDGNENQNGNQQNQKNQQGKKKNNGGGNGPKFESTEQAAEFYRRYVLNGETIPQEQARLQWERDSRNAAIAAKARQTREANAAAKEAKRIQDAEKSYMMNSYGQELRRKYEERAREAALQEQREQEKQAKALAKQQQALARQQRKSVAVIRTSNRSRGSSVPRSGKVQQRTFDDFFGGKKKNK